MPAFSASSGASCASPTTDRGCDVVESLYRGASSRPGLLRPYEPSLRPPEGTVDFAWLFRPDQPGAPLGIIAEGHGSPPDTGQQGVRTTSTSGVAAPRLPAGLPGAGARSRRWPAAALFAVGLAGALLLPWLVRSV